MTPSQTTPPSPSAPPAPPLSASPRLLRIATRASALAMWQARHIQARLEALHPGLKVELLPLTTQGDRILDRALALVGGKGLFVKEIEQALIDGHADLAVHSVKDLPADMPPGLTLAAIPERANPLDALVCRDLACKSLLDLPRGATVGTSSLRRRAQILAVRPDLNLIPLRGNVDTRLRKVAEGFEGLDAAILAAAGLQRLGLDHHISQILPADLCLPAIGQGTLGIQAREDDANTLRLLAPLHHPPTALCLAAERALLRATHGSCHLPLAAFATLSGDPAQPSLTLHAKLLTPDGAQVINHEATAAAPITDEAAESLGLGAHAALVAAGGQAILDALQAPDAAPDAPGASSSASSIQPLAGRRVLITRSRDRRSSALSAHIRALGGQPIEVAAITIAPPEDPKPLQDALQKLVASPDAFDWVLFTSPNAVEHTFQALASMALDASVFKGCRVAAVGEQTAQDLRARELTIALQPPADQQRAEGFLSVLLAHGLSSGSRALLPAAASPSPVLPDGLRAAGVAVEVVTAYRTIPCDDDRARLLSILSAPPPGDITFASGSAVTAFAAMLPDLAAIRGWRVACIGPVTAQAARDAGITPDIISPTASLDALATALTT
jgi:hydroxymethylbilane synthase